jgi:hypothetical protein
LSFGRRSVILLMLEKRKKGCRRLGLPVSSI